ESHPQLLGLFIQQQYREDFIVDEPLQHLGHALQQSVQVERGVDRVRHLQQVAVERRRNQGLLGGRRHQAGVLPHHHNSRYSLTCASVPHSEQVKRQFTERKERTPLGQRSMVTLRRFS